MLEHVDLVIHRELDIPFDTMRVKLSGGDNGHNSLRSVPSSQGTGDFYRVRVGIGRPPGRQDRADWVLSNYSSTERTALPSRSTRRRTRSSPGSPMPASAPADLDR